MKRAYLWSTEIDETQKFCEGCGNILPENLHKFCDAECKHIVNTRWPQRKWRAKLDYWDRKTEFIRGVFNRMIKEYPSIQSERPEGMTDSAWMHTVYRWARKNIPSLQQERKEWMEKYLGRPLRN